jgi:hypothetical protein
MLILPVIKIDSFKRSGL